MRIEFNIDIFFPNVNNAPINQPPNYIDRVYVVRFWVGKDVGSNPPVEGSGSGPTAFLLSSFSPAYFGTNASEPTFFTKKHNEIDNSCNRGGFADSSRRNSTWGECRFNE